ncbi:MAG: TonB-dependent receptor, partial [Chitinispirillaceae bacterium]|nr:TonB-dependent receptor [Chitinispirillaceae bacterium]
VYGAAMSLNVSLPGNVSLKGSAVYTRGEEQDEETGEWATLRHASPLSLALHFTYDNDALHADLYGLWNDEIIYDRLPPSERDKPYLYATDASGNPYCPMWYTINFKAAYKLSRNFSINCGVENIFDARYRPYSSGIAAPGRNFILGMQAEL